MDPLRVVICGGGFAAAECLLRLHRLAGERVAIRLLAPNEYLNYRPLTVLVPFGESRPAQYPIGELAAAAGAQWVHDRAVAIEHRDHIVHTANGRSLNYDALLLAPGGKERKPDPHVAVFTDRTGGHTYHGIVEAIDTGRISSLALIDPHGPSWPLPLYELALLTAKHARERRLPLQITMITPYPHPLYPFGDEVGATVVHLLESAGITLYMKTSSHFAGDHLIHLEPAGVDLHPDRIVTVPTITGPNLPGVPGDARDRFIPVDEHCRVVGTDGHVFAAGDATDLTVKHGSLAAQQADTAAAGIAYLVDAVPAPEPFRPVLRGTLLTGDAPLYLQANLVAGTSWGAQLLTEPTWPSDQLVAAQELAAYLAEHPAQKVSQE
ncbi:FAD/NAD(P)-binding oxidoreductase [Mycobacterium sp.]|uniref:FAD-dependent oxidoreductase n=1 Tax=Mycobacterium sp. TaxID=1785 RepID=UPI0011F5A1AA|nr:FAD/NAD(P)-binding oxidoreductase [Mycobacterium sp.]TAM68870.1 MAG: NAD(P)/FAD-dependent oxidoreductase [Mycobacterium sp.]